MAHDDVILTAERHFRALDADAAAGRGLSGDGDITLDRHFRTQRDVTADVEDNDPICSTHGIAKRTRAAVRERGDMIDRPGAAAGGIGAETLRSRKSRRLRVNGSG